MSDPYFGAVRPFDDRLAPVRKRKEKPIKEGNIREALKARVEAYGGEIRAVSWLGRNNAPDVLCLFPSGSKGAKQFVNGSRGCLVWVEAKRPKKDATEAQAREHDRLRLCNAHVRVISNLDELDAWLPPL